MRPIHIIFIFISVWFVVACKSNKSLLQYNTPQVWQHLIYTKATPTTHYDTAFIVVSNRIVDSLQQNFALEYSDTAHLHYLYVGKKNNKWYVHEQPDLNTCMQFLPQKDWLLYTEGMGKIFTNNIERAYLMATTYQLNVILFDYPSITTTKSMISNFHFSMHNAINAAAQWDEVLNTLYDLYSGKQFFTKNSLSLFFHSMGNLTIKEWAQHITRKYPQPFVNNLILNAACVNQKNHTQWLSNISFAKNIYIHYNKADYKLRGASFLTLNRKLGTKPSFKNTENIHYINFHDEVDKTHNYFLNIPGRNFTLNEKLKQYYFDILHGVPLYKDSSNHIHNIAYRK